MATHVWVCEYCGLRIPNPDNLPVYHKCKNEQKKPGTTERVTRYIGAVARWVKAGRPERTDEEVERILEEFCKPCNYYQDGICTHKKCGCNVNDRKTPLLNKLKMATEKCPDGQWN